VDSGGPRSGEAPARGYRGPGRILLRHSNKWYQIQESPQMVVIGELDSGPG
jgi:hypothetical protein